MTLNQKSIHVETGKITNHLLIVPSPITGNVPKLESVVVPVVFTSFLHDERFNTLTNSVAHLSKVNVELHTINKNLRATNMDLIKRLQDLEQQVLDLESAKKKKKTN